VTALAEEQDDRFATLEPFPDVRIWHYNPAVTVAFTIGRHFPPREAVSYIGAQLGGAIAGALLLLAAWPDQPAHLGATLPSVPVGTALLYEIVLTAILMFVITAVATDTRAVGAAARSIGPAIASGTFTDLWIYIAGPAIGAVLGVRGSTAVRGQSARGTAVP
jgi:aquaporin NIP